MKRLFDIILALIAAAVLLVPFVLVWLAVRLTSRGPALFWSDRIGQHNALFKMPKFRSMHVGTLVVATHLLSNPKNYLTPIGSFLRKSSLDELPQLWNVLLGDMSLVGPRPGLPSQTALTEARLRAGVFEARPGITGLAQLQGVDMSTPENLAEVDARMRGGLTLTGYLRCVVATALGGGRGDRVNR